jgi:hypothetical protein
MTLSSFQINKEQFSLRRSRRLYTPGGCIVCAAIFLTTITGQMKNKSNKDYKKQISVKL